MLSGCYTIPRHYNNDSEVVYYEPMPEPPIIIIDPPPPPPRPILIGVPVVNPTQPRERQQDLPNNNSSSYSKRDPLQGNHNRGGIDPKPVPPVRITEQKDRGHE